MLDLKSEQLCQTLYGWSVFDFLFIYFWNFDSRSGCGPGCLQSNAAQQCLQWMSLSSFLW